MGASAARQLTAPEAARRVWDLVVIGAGSAGLVASRTAAGLGARVLLVEADELGGECLHTGCVPSKALIASADAARNARVASRLGVDVRDVEVDFARVMGHVRSAIATIAPTDSIASLTGDGVWVVLGRARFTAADRVDVDGSPIRFRDAVLATGSNPVVPRIDGIDAVDVLTNETFFDLETLPERLLVQGGGAIGCEIAQAMARLGSVVTLVHRGPRLLPKEDPAASAIILAAFEADGVDVRLDTEITALEGTADGVASAAGSAHLDDGSVVAFDRMLAALGRRVDTDGLGLAAAGVAVDDRGAVAVDPTLRTSNPRIRAAGDVTPLPRFTHTAGTYGSVAATNAVLGLSLKADTRVVPRVTFTSPEVGAVGAAPEDAARLGLRVLVRDHAHLDRAIAEDDTSGRTTLLVDAKGRVQGAAIVGPRAGESLAEMTTAMKAGLTVSQLATTIHAYPTYSDAGWNAAVGEAQRRLRIGLTGRVIGLLRRIRRRRG